MNPLVDIIIGSIPEMTDQELEQLVDRMSFELWERHASLPQMDLEGDIYYNDDSDNT